MRDYNKEYQDFNEKKYAYDFDDILRKYMIRTLHPFFRQGKALELGCYKGDFTKFLVHYFDDLTVADASTDLLSYVKERFEGKVKCVHGMFEEIEMETKYDAIFLIHTLEHLDDPVTVLTKIKSWLTDSGKLFVAVPNANAPSRQIAVKMGLIPYNRAVTEGEYAHGHRNTYAFDTLEREVKTSGLRIISKGGVFFKPFANFQFDQMIGSNMISDGYLEGCYQLGMEYPDLCASIFVICDKGE